MSGFAKKDSLAHKVPKPSLKINVDEYVEGQELYGVDNITLNNSVQDPSLIRQCIGLSTVYRRRLSQSPMQLCPRLCQRNRSGYLCACWTHQEDLRTHFDEDDGDLYEGTVSDFGPIIYQTFEPKNDDTNATLDPIVSLKEALENTIDIESTLNEHIDLDAFLTFWALESILGTLGWAILRIETTTTSTTVVPRKVSTFIPWGLGWCIRPRTQWKKENHLSFQTAPSPMPSFWWTNLTEQLNDRVQSLMDTVWNEAIS